MTFDKFLSQFWPSTINGIVVGSVYALVALGYTLVYGVLRLINFANSEVFMFAAFGSFIAVDALGINDGGSPVRTGMALVGVMAACLLVSVLIGGVTAVVIERVAYRPLRQRNAPRLVFLISAIGVSFAISEYVGEYGFPSGRLLLGCLIGTAVGGALWMFVFKQRAVGRSTTIRNLWGFLAVAIGTAVALVIRGISEGWGLPIVENKKRQEYGLTKFFKKETVFSIFSGDVQNSAIIVVFGAALMALVLVLFVNKSRVGRGIRAVAQDSETARLMGVNVDRIIMITFLVGGLMAGGAAFLYELHTPYARYDVGFLIGVKAFTAAVLGGIGNVKGALIGGVLLGVIETWGASMFGADQNIGTVASFVTLVVVLMFRPSGLLGESLGRSKA